MDDYRIKLSWRSSRKRKFVMRKLGAEGVLAVIDLWAYATAERPDGDLSGLTDDEIADEAGWLGDASALMATLVDCKLLDGEEGERKIHDWAHHNPYVATHQTRVDKARTAAEARWGKHKTNEHATSIDEHATSINEHATSIDEHCREHQSALPRASFSNAPSPSPSPTPKIDKKEPYTQYNDKLSTEYIQQDGKPGEPGDSTAVALTDGTRSTQAAALGREQSATPTQTYSEAPRVDCGPTGASVALPANGSSGAISLDEMQRVVSSPPYSWPICWPPRALTIVRQLGPIPRQVFSDALAATVGAGAKSPLYLVKCIKTAMDSAIADAICQQQTQGEMMIITPMPKPRRKRSALDEAIAREIAYGQRTQPSQSGQAEHLALGSGDE